MIEARVTCKTRTLQVPDLGLVLHQGEVVYLSVLKVSASKNLAQARQGGAVEVAFVERAQVIREAPKAPRPVKTPSRIPQAQAQQVVAPKPDLARVVRQAVAAEVAKAKEELRAEAEADKPEPRKGKRKGQQ